MNNTNNINTLLARALNHHVTLLADNIGERNINHPKSLRRAADYIIKQWEKLEYKVVTQDYTVNSVRCANLEITLPGSGRQAHEIILVGAHYDTIKNCPGANGNASGIAILLELSRLFKQLKPKRTVHFVAFTNKEPPFYGSEQMGSWLYARTAQSRGDEIKGALILDSLGYYDEKPSTQLHPPLLGSLFPERGDCLTLIANLRSNGLLRRTTKAFRNHSEFLCHPICLPRLASGIAKSDHTAFWLNDYPALMITDTAKYRYPFHAQHNDKAYQLDYKAMSLITQGLAKTIMQLAEDE